MAEKKKLMWWLRILLTNKLMKRLNGKLVSKYRDQTWGFLLEGFELFVS
jgi:hypothetical protein